MGVYIKDIKMPKNCEECDFATVDDIDFEYNLFCKCSKKYCDLDAFGHPIGWNCPLIEVPTPHGRLIDADAYIAMMEQQCDRTKTLDEWVLKVCRGGIKTMPTIIEAEGSE